MHDIGLIIGGAEVPSQEGETFDRLDPLSQAVATRAAAGRAADASRAVEAASAAFAGWAETGPNHRRKLLTKAAEEVEAMASEFISAMQSEIGATASWAGFNVGLAAGILREAASLTTQVSGRTIPSDKPGCVAMSFREPAGVCVGIAPWNAPVILGVRALATPLACGNTVVLKASEVCPRTHYLIGSALLRAGFPPGVINVLTNAPDHAAEVVNALIDHPAVRRINFTGSTRVGRLIAERAARHLKPVLLELGGKAPLLVLKDADLGEAVAAAAFGAFFNQGQICMSTERIILEAPIAEEFALRFAEKARTLTSGDPREGKTPLGAMVSVEAAHKIHELVEDAVAKGAILLAGSSTGEVLNDAVVLDKVTAGMRIYSEESFGPVVCLVRAENAEDAVRLANDSEYGLSAAVFSRNIATAIAVATKIRSGICHINGPTVHDEAQMPFGGVKDSGYGRFGGIEAISEFTDLRWLTIETRNGRYPI